jgi:hypothetical protein
MEIWSGDISCCNGPNFKKIHLFSTDSSNTIKAFQGFSKLQYLSEIVVSAVPFAIVAGPSYYVWTEDEETTEWLSRHLLKEPPLESSNQSWFDISIESYSGLLFRPEYDDAKVPELLPVTELLFYATRGSEPKENDQTPCLNVLALPLCSHQIKQSTLVTPSPTSNGVKSQSRESDCATGFFLSEFSYITPPIKNGAKDIFETANELRKKAVRRGGAGIQAAAAGVFQARLLVGHKKVKPTPILDSKVLRFDTSSPGGAAMSLQSPALLNIKQPLRRSPSLPLSARPQSRRESQDLVARTPLSRSASVFDPSLPGESTLEKSNKDIVSRLIMAGMRLHGLQLRKKSEKEKDGTGNADDQKADDEFKMIYHQTYKAVIFAFVSYSRI